jgi:hypothetical protein
MPAHLELAKPLEEQSNPPLLWTTLSRNPSTGRLTSDFFHAWHAHPETLHDEAQRLRHGGYRLADFLLLLAAFRNGVDAPPQPLGVLVHDSELAQRFAEYARRPVPQRELPAALATALEEVYRSMQPGKSAP